MIVIVLYSFNICNNVYCLSNSSFESTISAKFFKMYTYYPHIPLNYFSRINFQIGEKCNIWNWGWNSFWQSFKNWFHYRDIFYSNIIENQNFSTFWMLFLYSKHVLKNTATVVWKFIKNKNVSIGDLYASNHLYWRWNFDKTER